MLENIKKRIYFDTNIFMHLVHQTEFKFDLIQPIENKASKKEIFIVSSSITRVEFFRFGDKPKKSDLKKINDYLDRSYFRFTPVDTLIAIKAQELCNKYHLTFHDAIHLATAINVNCSLVLTYDGSGKKNKTPLTDLDTAISMNDGRLLRINSPDQYWYEIELARYLNELEDEKNRQNQLKNNDEKTGQESILDGLE